MRILIKPKRQLSRGLIIPVILGLTFTILAGAALASIATAAPAVPRPGGAPADDACLGCHGQEGFSVDLPSGEVLSLTINADDVYHGVHAQNNINCVLCHTDISSFPHPPRKPGTLRELALHYVTTCQKCHQQEFERSQDSVHQKAFDAGNQNAAVCTDCHNPHYQERITDPATGKILQQARAQIPGICARCHSAIYAVYRDSVHGSALLEQNNADVPTCVDCHGVHNIPDPTTAAFRLKSPTEMCGKCHTDPQVMDKYGISTDVLSTYVSDFHGTTVTLFEQTSPDQETNKPVCFDCHGVHDIKRVDDPQHGIAIKKNLQVKCQQCHPGINENFPDAWLSHYIPSPEKAPLVYYVNLFYQIMIPAVIGGMLIFVISDFIRRQIDRRKGAAH